MTDAKFNTVEQVQVFLAAADSPEARLSALSDYADLLKTNEGLLFLSTYAGKEEALKVRHAILQFLMAQKAQVLWDSSQYSDMLWTFLATEVESPIRQTAALGLAQMMPFKEDLVKTVIDVLKIEGDFALHKIFCEALIARPIVNESLWPEIVQYATVAPIEMHPHILELVKKAPTAEIKENILLDMLKPTSPESTRESLVQQLLTAPSLSPHVCEALGVKHLARESSLKIVTMIVGKIFSQSQLSSSVAQAILKTIMGRGAEALPLLTMFSFKLHSQPLILENFLAAARDPQTNAKTKLFILSIVKNTGIFQFWDLALKDSNPVLRGWALQNSKNILEKQPQLFLELLLECYAKESSYFLRQQMLHVIQSHPSAMGAVSVDKWMGLFSEKNPLLLQKIAEISLKIPYDRANKNLEALPKIWVRLLGNAHLSQNVQDHLLERIESIEFKGVDGLDTALRKILSEIRSFSDLQKYYPRIEKLVHDPKFILPQYAKLIEKFIGYYAQSPLPDMLKTIESNKGHVPEVAAKIPHLAAITKESWLLSEMTEQQQKENLFSTIVNHINVGELTEAAKLIKTGFENSTLRKSEIVKLYKMGLAHPEMYEITQDVTDIMQKVNVVNEETVAASFQFLATFSAKNNSQHQVLEYLTKMGPQVPGYQEKYYQFLSQETFLNYVRQHESPQKDNASKQHTRDWDDSVHWQASHKHWDMFDRLVDEQKLKWIREKLTEPFNTQIPIAWSIQKFALMCYYRRRDFKVEDFMSLAQMYTAAKNDPNLHFFTDRVACLFSEKWNDLWRTEGFNDESRKKLPPLVVDTATDIFSQQVYNWLDLGGLEYSGRVAPMFGISLARFKSAWKRDSAQWDAFWQGYIELFGVNGLAIIPPEPNTKVREPARFHRVASGESAGLREFFQFLFYNEAPPVEDVEYNKMWRKFLLTASKRLPDYYANFVAEVDVATKQRLAEASKTSAAG